MAGTATSKIPASIGQRAALAAPSAGGEESQHGEGPRGELHGRSDAEHHPRREGFPSLSEHHGEEQEGHDRDVIAARRQRERGQGEDDEHLEGADLASPVGAAQGERDSRDRQRRQAEEDAGVTQTAVRPDLARDAGHGHEREVREEAGVVGLARRVVRHRVVEAARSCGTGPSPAPGPGRPSRPRPPRAAGASRGPRRSATGSRSRAARPANPRTHRPRRRGGPPRNGGAGVRSAGRTVAAAPRWTRPGEHGRGQRAEGERRQRHAAPHLVEVVGRRPDGDEREDGAPGVEEGVARLGRDASSCVRARRQTDANGLGPQPGRSPGAVR